MDYHILWLTEPSSVDIRNRLFPSKQMCRVDITHKNNTGILIWCKSFKYIMSHVYTVYNHHIWCGVNGFRLLYNTQVSSVLWIEVERRGPQHYFPLTYSTVDESNIRLSVNLHYWHMGGWRIFGMYKHSIILLYWLDRETQTVHFNAHSSWVRLHWLEHSRNIHVITHKFRRFSLSTQFVLKINNQIFVLIWSMLNFRAHQRNSLFI